VKKKKREKPKNNKKESNESRVECITDLDGVMIWPFYIQFVSNDESLLTRITIFNGLSKWNTK